jgi:hypothetical protein
MKLELSLHASKLKNVAGSGTSDPFVVVTALGNQPGAKPNVLGKTEVVPNSLSPHWVKVFILDYELGTPIKVACNVFDQAVKGGAENKSMGSAVFDIGELLGARGNTKAKKLKGNGTLFANVRKATGSGTLRLQCKGSKLKNVEGMMSKSDPFFELSRKINSAGGLTWDNVFRSPSIKNSLNPEWESAVIDLSTLCGGDLDSPIKIEVYDYESSGKHKPMGSAEMSVKGMQTAASTNNPIKLIQKGKDVGSFYIVRAEVSGVDSVTDQLAATSISRPTTVAPIPTTTAGPTNFVDYVSGGCELNVVVAIDFTGSNGDPRQPGTLHHLDAHSMNPYEKAISAIVTILAKFDSDQKFPVLGFGAKYSGQINHCFRCGPSEEVHGVKGVLDAYDSVFKSGLVMSGPTVFTEVIECAAARATSSMEAAQRRGQQTYTILLIVTDGEVSDVPATAQCLDNVSNAPLSVVIVGVGDADFSGMRFLDDKNSGGGGNKRDIAQFVQFNQHSNNSVALTSETLKEIPNQLVQYFQQKNIAPLPPLQRSDSTIGIDDVEEEIDLRLNIEEDEIVVVGGGDGFVDGFAKSR